LPVFSYVHVRQLLSDLALPPSISSDSFGFILQPPFRCSYLSPAFLYLLLSELSHPQPSTPIAVPVYFVRVFFFFPPIPSTRLLDWYFCSLSPPRSCQLQSRIPIGFVCRFRRFSSPPLHTWISSLGVSPGFRPIAVSEPLLPSLHIRFSSLPFFHFFR